MDAPSWSSQANLQPEVIKFERFRLQENFVDYLAKSAGQYVFERLESNEPQVVSLKSSMQSLTGVLFTSNNKRRSSGRCLLAGGTLVGCIYSFGTAEVEERKSILWQAVQRDFEHQHTKVSFSSLPLELVRAASAFLSGSCREFGMVSDLRKEVEHQFAEHVGHNESALIVCSNTAGHFFVFYDDSKIIGTLAAVGGPSLVVGYSNDLDLLNLKPYWLQDVESFYELYVCSCAA